jgi:hypothetical protein
MIHNCRYLAVAIALIAVMVLANMAFLSHARDQAVGQSRRG